MNTSRRIVANRTISGAFLTGLIAVLICGWLPNILTAQTLQFSWGGEVGTDPSAQGVDGVSRGNTDWQLNGVALPAGTQILLSLIHI